jgi:hypothetical protein
MTDETEQPLLSEDELRILESIVRDETRSMGEQYGGLCQLQAQLEASEGLSHAEHRTLAERLLRSLRECHESMERLRSALRAISDDALARLTPTERAQVAHLVVYKGEGVLQAIAKVTEPKDDDT